MNIHYGGDEALALCVAIDSALTCLACKDIQTGMAAFEITHAEIQLRALRKRLMLARSEALSAIISKGKT